MKLHIRFYRYTFVYANNQITLIIMSEQHDETYDRQHNTALLFEYIKSSSTSTSSISTEHYAIGYIIHGNCRVHSESRSFDIPEQCLYVLERGKHIIRNNPDCNGIFEQIVMHLDRSDVAVGATAEVDDKRLESVVMGAVAENLTLEELAERCFVSVSTFKRRFRKRFSLPPHKWFIVRKLDLAYRMILATDVAVTEVARLSGFTNSSHFIAAFKRRYNITPASLRRQQRKEQKELTQETTK